MIESFKRLVPQDSPTFDKFSIGAICVMLVTVLGLVIRGRERTSSGAINAELLKRLMDQQALQRESMEKQHLECMAMLTMMGKLVTRVYPGGEPPEQLEQEK